MGIPTWESHVEILWESHGNSHRKPVGMGWEWELKFHFHGNHDNQSLNEKKRKTKHDDLFVLDLEKFLEISEDECEQKRSI